MISIFRNFLIVIFPVLLGIGSRYLIPPPSKPLPVITVEAVFPGANARVVADTVAAPIEQQINGIEDARYLRSQCGNDGTYTLHVAFRPDVDLNMAQVLVQNRVALALPIL